MDRRRPEWLEQCFNDEPIPEEEPCPEFVVPMPDDLNDICVPCETKNWKPDDCTLEPALPG